MGIFKNLLMKRPMVLCGIGAIILSAVYFIVPFSIATVLIAVLISLFAVFVLLGGIKRTVYLLPALIIFITVALTASNRALIRSRGAELVGVKTVVGEVCEIEGYSEHASYVIKANRVGPIKQKCRIRVISNDGYLLHLGDRVSLEVEFFDNNLSKRSDLAEDILFVGFIKNVHSVKANQKPIYMLKSAIGKALSRDINFREAGLLRAIMLGDKSTVSDETLKAFRGAGIGHIVVVSGLHVSILAGFMYSLFKRSHMSKRKSGILGVLFVFLLMALTGFTVSVIRAGLTYIIMFSGSILARKGDPLNSLFTAIMVILIFNPFAFMSVSLQLSSVATLGVLVVAPAVQSSLGGKASRFMGYIKSATVITLSAFVLTMPFCIYHFGVFSPVSIISNIIIGPLATATLAVSLLAVLFAVFPPLGAPILLAAGLLSKLIIVVSEAISSLPIANLTFDNITLPVILSALFAAAFAVFSIKSYDKKIKLERERKVREWLQ